MSHNDWIPTNYYNIWVEANTTTNPKHKEYSLMRLAGTKDCPQDILRELCESSIKVRRVLASREVIPKAVCVYLSRDCDQGVREAIARHPDTPSDILLALGGSRNQDVVRNVLANSNCPPEVLVPLACNPRYYYRKACILHRNMPHGVWCRDIFTTQVFPRKTDYLTLRSLP